jgi:hypothetical protein
MTSKTQAAMDVGIVVGAWTLPAWLHAVEPWLQFWAYAGTGLIVVCRGYLAVRAVFDHRRKLPERLRSAAEEISELE